MRLFSLLLPLTLLALPVTAQAGPPNEPVKTLEEVLSKKSSSDSTRLSDSLPSSAQIEAMIDDLPDFNHFMDGLIEMAQDEKIREKFTDSAAHMKDELEKSGALKPRSNGLPDINASLEVMLRSLSDKKGLGGMLDALELAGDDFEVLLEESMDKSDDT